MHFHVYRLSVWMDNMHPYMCTVVPVSVRVKIVYVCMHALLS